MSEKVYKKMSVIFYDNNNDTEMHDKLAKLAKENSDSKSTYTKRIILEHLKQKEKDQE